MSVLRDKNVKITIITATYNCADTLVSCLDSVAEQTYLNREHVVIDGASQDDTMCLLLSRRAQLSALVHEPDNGIYDALNKGIDLASGDVLGFLHADDVYADPYVLGRIAEVFREDSQVCAVYGDLQYVRREDVDLVVRKWRSSRFTRRHLEWGWMPPHPTLYVRREWYKRIGGFDCSYRIAADYFSILSLFSQPDFKAVYLPQVLVKMRVGGISNRSMRNITRKSFEDFDALRRSGVGGLGALAWKNISKIGQFFG